MYKLVYKRFNDDRKINRRCVEVFHNAECIRIVEDAFIQVETSAVHIFNVETGDRILSFVNMEVLIEYYHNLR